MSYVPVRSCFAVCHLFVCASFLYCFGFFLLCFPFFISNFHYLFIPSFVWVFSSCAVEKTLKSILETNSFGFRFVPAFSRITFLSFFPLVFTLEGDVPSSQSLTNPPLPHPRQTFAMLSYEKSCSEKVYQLVIAIPALHPRHVLWIMADKLGWQGCLC